MSHSDLDPELQRLGDALRASTTIDLARAEPVAHPATAPARRPRRRILAGSTLGLAGVGAALVLALGGSAAAPAFAITRQDNGSVLVTLSYLNPSERSISQVNAKLAAMGTGEQIIVFGSTGPATVAGPVTCAPAAGAPRPSGPTVKVLVGTDGTEVIGAGQSADNTAEGTFHVASCTSEAARTTGGTGNTGSATGSVQPSGLTNPVAVPNGN